jgi:phosphate transport system permease protein
VIRRRLLDRSFTLATAACAALSLGILATLVALVVGRGAGALSWTFLTEQIRSVGADGGIFYHLVGTAILVTTAAVVAVPLAAGVGVFLRAYLPPGRRARVLEGGLHALNGVPSIVFGLVGFAVFFHRLGWRKSWLAGGILLGVMILPTVAVSFLEKLRAVPAATVEAAAGLGLSRSAVVRTVLFPQAASGLVTGTLLGLARAAGETAPIMFTAAIFAGATVPHGVVDSPVLALPYHIFVLAQDSFAPGIAEKVWGSAIVLLVLVAVLSLVALPFRLRAHEEARRG